MRPGVRPASSGSPAATVCALPCFLLQSAHTIAAVIIALHEKTHLILAQIKRLPKGKACAVIGRKMAADRHMGTEALGLSEAVPQGCIHQSSHERQAEYIPCRH